MILEEFEQKNEKVKTGESSLETDGKVKGKKVISKGDMEFSFKGDAINQKEAIQEKIQKTKVFGPSKVPTHFVVDDDDGNSIVWMAQDLKCTIGRDRFHFKKDGKYRVNQNVKNVLVNRGCLKAL